jgi:hypothetical protein
MTATTYLLLAKPPKEYNQVNQEGLPCRILQSEGLE